MLSGVKLYDNSVWFDPYFFLEKILYKTWSVIYYCVFLYIPAKKHDGLGDYYNVDFNFPGLFYDYYFSDALTLSSNIS